MQASLVSKHSSLGLSGEEANSVWKQRASSLFGCERSPLAAADDFLALCFFVFVPFRLAGPVLEARAGRVWMSELVGQRLEWRQSEWTEWGG